MEPKLPDLSKIAAAQASQSTSRVAVVTYRHQLAGLFESGYNWKDALAALNEGLTTTHPGLQLNRTTFKKHCLAEGLKPRPKSNATENAPQANKPPPTDHDSESESGAAFKHSATPEHDEIYGSRK